MSVLSFPGGGPGRLRTYDNPVMSRGLYQLSYGSNSGNIPGLPCLGKGKDVRSEKKQRPCASPARPEAEKPSRLKKAAYVRRVARNEPMLFNKAVSTAPVVPKKRRGRRASTVHGP